MEQEDVLVEKLSEDEARCPQCTGMLLRLKSGEVEVRCRKCRQTYRAKVILVRKIVVEIIEPRCDTAPAPT